MFKTLIRLAGGSRQLNINTFGRGLRHLNINTFGRGVVTFKH